MDNNVKLYSMKETCKKTNLNYDTLKFYCNEGLIPNVKRNKSNYRVFDENDINWINSLACLKNCGMSIAEMKEYLNLCLKGESSIPKRQIILNKKLDELEEKRKKLDEAIEYVHWKQQFYQDILSGKKQYYSYLNNTKSDEF